MLQGYIWEDEVSLCSYAYRKETVWKVLWPGQSQLAQVAVWVDSDRSKGSFLAHMHQPEGVSS